VSQYLQKISLLGPQWHVSIIAVTALLLYANTLGHQYAQDDAIVIYDNMYTQDGVKGIKGHLTKDTFFGFFKTEGKDKLVSGGRYRPLTPILFCVGYEIFGDNPMIGHLMNSLWYALLCCLIYFLVLALTREHLEQHRLFALIVALLFMAHPIHTEAVANIKGRDEIFSMLGSVIAFLLAIKYVDKGKMTALIGAGIAIFLGLMSKENTITYLAVIPLGIILLPPNKKAKITRRLVAVMGGLLLGTIAFLAIRTSILGLDFGAKPLELMNNPFLKWNGSSYEHFTLSEKMSSILVSLGIYLKLMIAPINLCHDYYPGTIDLVSLTNWKPLLSLGLHIILLAIAVIVRKRMALVTFGILYYFITLSIVSNVVFSIGTNLSERFLFMPSLGLIIAAVAALWYSGIKKASLVVGLGLVVLAYSVRTVLRNPAWYDDYTLFTTDVGPETKSAKLLNAAGGTIVNRYFNESDQTLKKQKMQEAEGYLKRAIAMHPTYSNAWHILGTAQSLSGNYAEAVVTFDKVLALNPSHEKGMSNLIVTLRDAGKHAGQTGDLQKSIKYLLRAESLDNSDPEIKRLLGIAYGMSGNHQNAIKYFQKVLDKLPKVASSYVNLAIAYQNIGDNETAKPLLEKAVDIDPNALNYLQQQ